MTERVGVWMGVWTEVEMGVNMERKWAGRGSGGDSDGGCGAGGDEGDVRDGERKGSEDGGRLGRGRRRARGECPFGVAGRRRRQAPKWVSEYGQDMAASADAAVRVGWPAGWLPPGAWQSIFAHRLRQAPRVEASLVSGGIDCTADSVLFRPRGDEARGPADRTSGIIWAQGDWVGMSRASPSCGCILVAPWHQVAWHQ